MNRVGIIEDLDDSFNDYKEIFQLENIELIRINVFQNIEELHEVILDEKLEALIIDYKLKPKYNFLGTEIVSKLNKIMPDFTCFILTVYPDESIEEELVSSNAIYDKKKVTVPDREEYYEFIEDIKHAANVFSKRKEILLKEYRDNISNKKDKEELDAKTKDEMKEKYHLLANYGIVEDIPMEMMEPEAQKMMDELIIKIDEFMKKK